MDEHERVWSHARPRCFAGTDALHGPAYLEAEL
jgi:hypothetical protein